MNRERELEMAVKDRLMHLLGPDTWTDRTKQNEIDDFLLHLGQWIDWRAREAVDPDE